MLYWGDTCILALCFNKLQASGSWQWLTKGWRNNTHGAHSRTEVESGACGSEKGGYVVERLEVGCATQPSSPERACRRDADAAIGVDGSGAAQGVHHSTITAAAVRAAVLPCRPGPRVPPAGNTVRYVRDSAPLWCCLHAQTAHWPPTQPHAGGCPPHPQAEAVGTRHHPRRRRRDGARVGSWPPGRHRHSCACATRTSARPACPIIKCECHGNGGGRAARRSGRKASGQSRQAPPCGHQP